MSSELDCLAAAAPQPDVDPLLCDASIAHEYALFQFSNLAAGIVGHAQLALNNPTYDSLKRSAQVSAEFGQKVADIARLLTVFARGSAGETGCYNLNDLLAEVVSANAAQLAEAGVRVRREFRDIPAVRIDPAAARKVFLQLLGPLACEAEVSDGAREVFLETDKAENAARVRITYAGLRVPRAVIEPACVPLFQGAGAAGGACALNVDVAPPDAQGTRLTLTIPVGNDTPPPPHARVLVVDDEAVILSIFSRFLTRAGHHVDTAAGGAAAIDAIRKNAYDIVLLDWMMPEIAGIDVLREAQAAKPDLPIVVVTAAYSARVARQAVEAGARECIGKPLNHRKVLYLIDKYRGASARQIEARDDLPTDGQGEVLLVADPDALARDLYHLVLDHAGYENNMVATYEDVCAALDKEYYDAILINAALLTEDVPSCVRTMRRLNPYTPILILGDQNPASAKHAGLFAGASAYIEKPVEVRRFLRKLRAILELYKEPCAGRFKG